MTNPNPTETAAPRWIPAASKPGGLVFGDVVRPNESPTEYAILGHDGYPAFDTYVLAEKDSHPLDSLLSADVNNLLVRIDPLPESTDSLRHSCEIQVANGEGYAAGMQAIVRVIRDQLEWASDTLEDDMLEPSDHETAHEIERVLGEIMERIAEEHPSAIPTPTEAADGPETDDHDNQ